MAIPYVLHDKEYKDACTEEVTAFLRLKAEETWGNVVTHVRAVERSEAAYDAYLRRLGIPRILFNERSL